MYEQNKVDVSYIQLSLPPTHVNIILQRQYGCSNYVCNHYSSVRQTSCM